MCPHGYHHNGFMETPALGTQEVRIYIYIYIYNTIHMYSGITSGRVLTGSAQWWSVGVGRNLYETVCRQMQTN